MSKFHFDTVISAVKLHAFPQIDNLDNYKNLPYQEPPFRHIKPGQTIVSKKLPNNDIIISKKPEGNREIFVCLFDKADSTVHMYSVDRHKNVKYIFPDLVDQTVPVYLPEHLEMQRRDSVAARLQNNQVPPNTLNALFVFDVCRVYSSITRNFVNVILSDLGPIRIPALSQNDKAWLMNTYSFVEKMSMVYTRDSDIDYIINTPENFPYNPENGVIFVQGSVPTPKSPCAKYTPPENASVYLHVLPIITLKARLWKLSYFHEGELKLYKTIPAYPNFYVPPVGMVVSFGISFDERNYWKFIPKRVRQDKLTPSALQTIQKFVARYLPRNDEDHDDHDTRSETTEERNERQLEYECDRAEERDDDSRGRRCREDNAFA